MSSLHVGTSFRDITPHYPTWAHGYGNRRRRSSGVLEPLSLGCLAIGNGETRILIVTIDMIGVGAGVCEELYALLARKTGVAFPTIMIAASHTHFAPALQATAFDDPQIGIVQPDPQYAREVKTNLGEAAREALGGMRAARLETVRRQAPQVLFNRRTVRKSDGSVETNYLYPEDPSSYRFSAVDSELTVLRFVDDAGVQAALVNFGCHPVTRCSPEEDDYRFSADYPYYLRRTIADKWHCPVFFTLGAAGDTVPINRRNDCRQRIGSVLGNTAILAERVYAPDASGELDAAAVEIEAETILKTDPAAATTEYEEARQTVLSLDKPNDGHKGSDEYQQAITTFWKKMAACQRASLYPKNKARIKAQFIRIGGTVLVGLPFEPFSEISLKMKERFPNSVLVSCAGGHAGYLPLAYEYERGGYEATEDQTHFAPGTADRLLEAILQRLRERSARSGS